ncbi:MAG TPA: DsrE family protein [Hyphomicrobiaceae bacterium]|nr:DsrE family protein [Hyphomicrobiaceae bacterium]
MKSMPQILQLVLVLVITMVATMAAPTVHADGRYGKQKAVYDVNYVGGEDDKAYFKALRNVQNHVNAVGKENIELKVMLSGDGLNMLKDANTNLKLQGVITSLKTQNVMFLVCNNTLIGRKIDPESLFEVFKEDIVPSGNAEMAHLQGKGYAYLKP